MVSPDCGGEVSDVRLSPFGPRIDLTVGDIETINCTASNAEPDSRVALYHNGTRVLDNTLHSYDPVACIRQISLLLNGTIDSDAGDYTCVYNQGNILRTSSVSVTVMPVPKGMYEVDFHHCCIGNMAYTAASFVLLHSC